MILAIFILRNRINKCIHAHIPTQRITLLLEYVRQWPAGEVGWLNRECALADDWRFRAARDVLLCVFLKLANRFFVIGQFLPFCRTVTFDTLVENARESRTHDAQYTPPPSASTIQYTATKHTPNTQPLCN